MADPATIGTIEVLVIVLKLIWDFVSHWRQGQAEEQAEKAKRLIQVLDAYDIYCKTGDILPMLTALDAFGLRDGA
jgi:hypothetical protein